MRGKLIYLGLCCLCLQFYLGVISYACSAIAKPQTEEIVQQTYELMLELDKSEGRPVTTMAKIKIEDPKPYTRPEYEWNNWSDVRKPSGITAEELHENMYYDENHYAPYYIEAERRYGVNAIFLYAIAQNESQNGRSTLAKTHNNLFGWTSLSHSGYKSFDSVEECIYYVAEAIQNNYLSENGMWFEGYSLWDVSRHYNDNDYWRNLTLEIADTMQRRLISSRKKQGI